MSGPLNGYRIIEIAGIGPAPFAAMMLSDLGAEVVRVNRANEVRSPRPDRPNPDVTARGRRSVAVDLKSPGGVEALLALVDGADALIEGFRPGVMERLGVGPDVCLARNPRLVFGRMTGWGQDGPYARAAGHDINYISLGGALAHFGRRGEAPVPPMNMVGDFGGGGMLLALGVVAGLLDAAKRGQGQVVDAAMVDGTALLMTMFWTLREVGMFDENRRGENMLDTGAHFYDVYRCADGDYV
ncbi:MAG: CoA transferase, partial [Actinomycetota bacterium]|nr:CoA transferase [Actinomycetota bacterium]